MTAPQIVTINLHPIHKGLLLQVRDETTGEVVMAQACLHVASWLEARGFHPVVSGRGVWAKEKT